MVLVSRAAIGEAPAPRCRRAPAAPREPPPRPEAAPKLAYLRAQVRQSARRRALRDGTAAHARLVDRCSPSSTRWSRVSAQGPLSIDGPALYAIGNKPHAAGDEQAILLVDVDRDSST
jgi:hypothetical protein